MRMYPPATTLFFFMVFVSNCDEGAEYYRWRMQRRQPVNISGGRSGSSLGRRDKGGHPRRHGVGFPAIFFAMGTLQLWYSFHAAWGGGA